VTVATVEGTAAAGFEAVVAAFEGNLTERGDLGAAFAVYVDGRPVVDVWGGMADRAAGRPWRQDTIAGIFSGTKGLVATCVLMLIERGALELDAPVCRYWPEFAAEGKESVLVRHVVSHQAGLPGLTTPVTCEEVGDDVRMARLLAAQPALHPPGGGLYYHALTFGWLCGELVRRVDGRSVGRFLAEEVAGPLGLDAWIGLPAEQEPRVALLERGEGFGAQAREQQGPDTDPVAWSVWSNPPRYTSDPLPVNTRAWRAAEIPGSSGVASAASLARLYGCLARGGELDGVRLLTPETLEQGRTRLSYGAEPYLGEPMAFGIGYELQAAAPPSGPPADAFGHNGAGGSTHGAWPELRTGFSYISTTLQDLQGPDPRPTALLDALHGALRP
jgi:CubicO group peptidase (beta-lactamase class C family)